MKVEIELVKLLETNDTVPIPIYIGRIELGDHVGKLYLGIDRKMRLFIEESAVNDGSIVLCKDTGRFVCLEISKEKS